MNRSTLQSLTLLGAATAVVMMTGCAQNVGDIDRVQPNYWSKAEFDGVWYTRQTIVDVPGTISGPFVGVSSEMEKIRWEVQEDFLIAYRAYEYIPGYDLDAGEKIEGETQYKEGHGEGRNPEYKEAPVAAFPIISHFDIQRSYNAQTGEQSNVIVENISDRPWYEREYIRVDWSTNLINPSFVGFLEDFANTSFFVQSTEESAEAFYEERDAEEHLEYFDFINKLALDNNELKVRYSFQKLEDYERDYEPVYYDDDYMTKFGYFRTERLVYDRRFGFHDRNYVRLANRHDLWEDDFKRDEDGEYLRDAEGRRIPVPLADRTPKPVVYYLSPNFPAEVEPGAFAMAADWNRAFQRAVGAPKGLSAGEVDEQYGDMFILCHNPVQDDDDSACDPRALEDPARFDADGNFVPFEARAGDLRRSFVYWVHQPQASGPLGYGPSFADPETGEIISGTAYVYGASVDTYAQTAVNYIRAMNGDLTEEELQNGDDILAMVLERLEPQIDPRGQALEGTEIAPELGEISLEDARQKLLTPHQREIFDRIEREGFESLEANPNFVQNQFDKMKDAGVDRLLLDDETIRALSNGQLDPANAQDVDLQKLLEENNPLDLHKRQREERERLGFAARHNIYLAEFADDAVAGTALKYKDRTDYDVIWNEIRNEIFRAVMAHEVGHTIGLRHNFQGSYDSVNYHDEYWELRKDNFRRPQSVDDLYAVNTMTDKQREGDMTRLQYSTIMDYHSRFNSDFSGIGKYDEAAIIFAYTTGTYADLDADNDAPLPQEAGYVEVFEDIPEDARFELDGLDRLTRDYLRSFDDRYAPSQHPLEDLHYTTVISALGGPEKIKNRRLVRYGELQAAREAYNQEREALEEQLDSELGVIDTLEKYNEYLDRVAALEENPVEVPYMFCSDEWAGATISCDRWDMGSDPLEIVQWAVRRYHDYYPFTHFRRGRMTFSSFSGASAASRSFNVMPFVYQQWFFDRYYSNDPTLSNYYTLAAYAGLNFLNDVVTMPSYGAYAYDANEDAYQLVSFDPEYSSSDVELRLYPGQGRRQFSRFDYGSGYYYFTRTVEAGHFWDYVFAMGALTSSAAIALGVDIDADFRSYSLPYYLMFEEEMTRLFNGLFRRDNRDIAPRVTANGEFSRSPLAALAVESAFGGQRVFDPFTGRTLPSDLDQSPPIDIRVNFSQRYYALLYSMAFFSTNYSKHYIDQARVFKLGNGEQINPGDGYELISFTDPLTGVSYGAIAPTGADEDRYGLGASMVSRGAELVQILRNATTQQEYSDAYYELLQLVENIGMVTDSVSLFGTSF